MKKIFYKIGKLSRKEQDKLDFSDGMKRATSERIELGFIRIKIPIIDDVPYRIFDSMKEYRIWADQNLPEWLGYNLIND